ncbi:MAG TPA: ferrous iron transport protein B [Methanolinea sp.]|nr:ferrous iron transport protein B [Methanolinea sp.]HQI13637.1 ferrous iron transport protein B [Methanolinea sp.]
MKIGLIGNPNVGKSLIFHQLTGIGVEVSNYPGTTVDLFSGTLCYRKERIDLVDLPGIYSLEGKSPEEEIVRNFITGEEVEGLVAVLDATHLERNLYLLLQVAEYKKPLVVVLNMMDEAEKRGIEIDREKLSSIIGTEVIPVTATQGKNVGEIIPATLFRSRTPDITIPYDLHIEAAIRTLVSVHGISRIVALQALQGMVDDPGIAESAGTLAREIEEVHRMSVQQIIAGNRHRCARVIAEKVIRKREEVTAGSLDTLLTSRVWGPVILCAVLAAILLSVFSIGSYLEEFLVGSFESLIVQPFLSLGLEPLPEQIGLAILLALQAGLGIAFPYIFTFYIFISILEDSGYLTRAAFLADSTMHRLGMHGQGIIPLILGFGCNVPAIMGLRLLRTRRERVIASFLVSMIPCSARTVIIAGIVAVFVGFGAALSIYVITFGLIILTGIVLSRITPGERYGMILELSPLRVPEPGNVLAKSWYRIREFLVIAMPLLVAASIVLGLLQYIGFSSLFAELVAPFSETILGLPGYAASALLFGILRKEMALETLVILSGTADLASVLTAGQIYVFAVVSVLFIPCISTMAVLARVVGARITFLVSLYTLILGVCIGALINILVV